jgi:hypothetical protein
VLKVNILPSPSADIFVVPYEEAAFPKFSELFKTPSSLSPLGLFAVDPEEASAAIVLENRSQKAVTALHYQWRTIDETGKQNSRTVGGDSYMVDVYHAVAAPGSRQLITPSGSVDEATIDHVRSGGGVVGGRIGGKISGSVEPVIVELTFEIDFVLFEDGEIAGPDPEKYALALQCRKPAAEFVAKQIRLAMAESRDVSPVLRALAEIPCFGNLKQAQGDRLVQWTRHYARDYLHAMERETITFDWREARLRHLESRPTLPKFYRRSQND